MRDQDTITTYRRPLLCAMSKAYMSTVPYLTITNHAPPCPDTDPIMLYGLRKTVITLYVVYCQSSRFAVILLSIGHRKQLWHHIIQWKSRYVWPSSYSGYVCLCVCVCVLLILQEHERYTLYGSLSRSVCLIVLFTGQVYHYCSMSRLDAWYGNSMVLHCSFIRQIFLRTCFDNALV